MDTGNVNHYSCGNFGSICLKLQTLIGAGYGRRLLSDADHLADSKWRVDVFGYAAHFLAKCGFDELIDTLWIHA